MKTPSKIKYDIFFCHPSKDRRKSSLIVNFLRVIIKEALNDKYRIFYSPEDLKQERAAKAWRRGLNYALKVSKCMIAYYTPNAYASKWMKYEIGAMASRDKPLIPITTGAVDLSKLLINDGTAKNIASGGIAALEDWVKNVIDEVAHKSPQRISNSEETNSINQEIKNVSIWFQNQSNLDKIERFLKEIKTQNIYIIGSKPRSINDKWNNGLVATLSQGLLDKEFDLSSSPSVKEVGFVVAKECLNVPSRYTIAGLHRFESDLIKTSEMSETSDEPIREAIKAFRKRYLMGVDAVIVIGGKQNTLAEIEVAKKENKSIFYLPCMGGIGTQCYDKAYSMRLIDKDYPCYSCDECISCRKIGKLCDYIANKLYELS